MPVEDLHFLEKNSVEDQFIMYVDSSRRDKARDPTPSSYTVTFTEPFRYVIGMEVLDVLVPRTMYNVDTDVNELRVVFEGLGEITIAVEPMDYDMDTIIDGINAAAATALKGRAWFRADPKTENPLHTGKIVFTSNLPFTLDLSASSMREVIGFDEPCRPHHGTMYRYIDRATPGSTPQLSDPVPHVLSEMELPEPVVVRAGDVMIYTFSYPRDCVLVGTGLLGGLAHTVRLTRTQGGQDEWPHVLAEVLYRLEITLSSDAEVVSNTVDSGLTEFLASRSTAPVSLLARLTLRTGTQRMEAPGLAVLTGHRCITLRCPEVEQYINSSYIYGDNSPGIALIKLATRGYTQQRFDFRSINYRRFTPVAKLAKVTFRFETLNGGLYDFKGCNHTMLVAIKYLEPRAPNAFDNFREHSLNPNYNPNFIEYIVNNQRRLEDVLSEEDDPDGDEGDEDDDIAVFANRYRRRL